ncbi:MAG: oligosaccharide flippase family protein [Synechococcaceae cyanobacterium SM2_3_2]|nr:oligosaccharide flippase family protein [Synechococcaceae cyanobacterium SM2_3_2]
MVTWIPPIHRWPKVWQNASWMMLGNGLRLAISACYFIGLARFLGPDDFGLFSGILACGVLASPFACLGQPDLLTQHLSRDPQDSQGLWAKGLAIAAVAGLILALLLWMPLMVWLPEADPGAVGLLILAEVWLTSLQHVQKGALTGLERIPAVAVIDTGMAAGRLGILLLAWLCNRQGLLLWSGLYAAMTAVAVLLTAAWIRSLRDEQKAVGLTFSGEIPPLFEQWWHQIKVGWEFAVGMIAIRTFAELDKLLLPRLASAAQGGIYSAAYRVINIAQTPVIALITSSFADICRAGESGIRSAWNHCHRLCAITVVYGCGVTGILMLGSRLLPWILGPEYGETAVALRWLAAVAGLEGIHLLLSVVLLGARQQRTRGYWQVAAVGLNGLLNVMWIPELGWRGAALATLTAEIFLVLALAGLILIGCRQEDTTSDV